MKISHLLGLREIQGRDILFNSRRYHFHKQYEEIQASQPTVWKFERTEHVYRAIERICIQLHTETGTRNALLLAASRHNGCLSFYQVDNPEEPHHDVESVWSPRPQNEVSDFPRLTSPSLSMVTTAGSGESKGSLYSLEANLTPGSAAQCLFETDGTVYTVDCNSAGTYVALGTSTGTALLDLEARYTVQMTCTESDVLSLQFLSSGNVVLCGLRNGSILTFDTRQKQISGNTEASDWSSATPNSHMTSLHAIRRERSNFIRPQVDKGLRLSGSCVRMTSAVCSMVSLSSDENYFIASSTDGSIKLFDIRVRNVVQSYKGGHVNSHNHLPLAVNPSETLLLSGYARHQLDQSQSSGPWLGSCDGLFYMQGI